MKKILCQLLLLLPFVSFSQGRTIVSSKTIYNYPNELKENWKYSAGDDSLMASIHYDDSHWIPASPRFDLSADSTPAFKGLGWFRLHFIADTSVTRIPLAIALTHYGASEIFLDGKKLNSFGVIKNADSSVYEDPQNVPFTFVLSSAGEHVIAVRYANFNASRNYSFYHHDEAGFRMMIGEANFYIQSKNEQSTVAGIIFMVIAGIFISLSLVHLCMYFYYRSERSNLFFSIFMFSLAACFVIAFISLASHSPEFQMKSFYMLQPIICIACISLSGFINGLTSRKKLGFRIIGFFGAAVLVLRFTGISASLLGLFIITLIVAALCETVLTIIIALFKRIKGAKIIGTGVLFFSLFLLTLFSIALINGGFYNVNGNSTGGMIVLIMMALAIISIPLSMSFYQAWSFARVNKDLGQQLIQVKVLSEKTLRQEHEKQQMLENRQEELEQEVDRRTAELQAEKKKSDDLLLNILPSETAEELKQKGSAEAKSYDEVTVLFTDFKNFTKASEKLSATELVKEIHHCYSAFDKIISRHNLEKIKTIGDSYMCAGGLPAANSTHPTDCVKAALEIVAFMEKYKAETQNPKSEIFEVRIGIHSGAVVAGIVGIKKFAYDIWGDTVNIASRMESSGEAGKVNISGATYELVKDQFVCVHRGKIEAKNKGMIDMYFVTSLVPME